MKCFIQLPTVFNYVTKLENFRSPTIEEVNELKVWVYLNCSGFTRGIVTYLLQLAKLLALEVTNFKCSLSFPMGRFQNFRSSVEKEAVVALGGGEGERQRSLLHTVPLPLIRSYYHAEACHMAVFILYCPNYM